MLSTENPQNRRIFLIIVHYGSPSLTNRAIASIQAGTTLPQAIVVIDQTNGQYQPADAVSVTVIPSTNNGYGAAANMGLGYLLSQLVRSQDIVIIMNNDVIFESTTIHEVIAWWQAHPEPALVGVQTQEGETALSGGGKVSLLTGRTKLLTIQDQAAVDYIHGAFVMAPYTVFIQAKGWPEQYFLYWEDIALSTRVRQRGIPLYVAPTVHITHEIHKSNARQQQQIYYLVRNGAVYLQTETAWGVRQWWRLYNQLRWGWHTWWQPNSVVTKALRDACRGQLGQVAL